MASVGLLIQVLLVGKNNAMWLSKVICGNTPYPSTCSTSLSMTNFSIFSMLIAEVFYQLEDNSFITKNKGFGGDRVGTFSILVKMMIITMSYNKNNNNSNTDTDTNSDNDNDKDNNNCCKEDISQSDYLFLKAHNFPRKMSENCSLPKFNWDSVCGKISEHIFAPLESIVYILGCIVTQ